jgi:hypothetical protein
MCTFAADYDRANGSPDRMDALVWGLSFLFEKMTGRRRASKPEQGELPYHLKDISGQQNNPYRGESDTLWMI